MAGEAKLESYFVEQWEALGGLTRKLKWIGRRNAPDRFAAIEVWQGLVEFKDKGKKPRAGQKNEIEELREHGVDVKVFDTFERVNSFIHKTRLKMIGAGLL